MGIPPLQTYSKGVQAIIFDMDDTMVPTMKTHFQAWTDLCLKHNPRNITLNSKAGVSDENLSIVEKAYNGCTSEEFIKMLFGNIPQKRIQALAQEREDLFVKQAQDLKEIPGLTNFLNMIDEIKKGIASSTSRPGIEHVLNKLNITKFFKPENIIDPSKVLRGKPYPDPYLTAAKALNVSPGNCLVFEDSKGGINAARSAGMRVVGVATSISKPDLINLGVSRAINDYTEIKSLDELKELLNVIG